MVNIVFCIPQIIRICFVARFTSSDLCLSMNNDKKMYLFQVHGMMDKELSDVEAIVILEEPDIWAPNLQLIIDLLLTNGRPGQTDGPLLTDYQLPVLACIKDNNLTEDPKRTEDSFLDCLENIYEDMTGQELHFAYLNGRNSELTYRYAEHVITEQAKKLDIEVPIVKLYIIR